MIPLKTSYKSIAAGIFLSAIFIAIISFIPTSGIIFNGEKHLQIFLLISAILIYQKIKTSDTKFYFKQGVIIIIIYSVLTNEFLWIMSPSSELNSLKEFLSFIFNNNYIMLIGVSTLLIKIGILKLLR